MAEDGDKSEKTEKATPQKIDEARKKGMVAKSQEIGHFSVLSTGLFLMVAIGHGLVEKILNLCEKIFSSAGRVNFTSTHLLDFFDSTVMELIYILSPLVVVIMLVGVLVTLVQTRPNISFFPLKPDFKKLNPITGFKKIFGLKMLFEFVKSLLKLMTFGMIVYIFIDSSPCLCPCSTEVKPVPWICLL